MKRRHYPPSIKIGKQRYRLDLVPYIEEVDGNVTRGYCETKEKLITLLDKQNEQELFSTLLHEVLHAIEKEHGMKLSHKLIYSIEGPLAQFLLENFYVLPRR